MTAKAIGRRCMPAWRVPADIYGEGPFLIDAIVQSCSLRTGWPADRRRAEHFARRGLEVSILSAVNAEEDDLGPKIARWEQVEVVAGRASGSLRQLVNVLGPETRPTRVPEEMILALRTSKVPDLMSADPAAAQAAALALWRALELADALAGAAQGWGELLRTGRPHEGDPPYRAFAACIGVTWAYLTGKRPTAGSNGGPFQRFLAAAWIDAGGRISDDETGDDITPLLAGARHARDMLSQDEVARVVRGRPDWWRE